MVFVYFFLRNNFKLNEILYEFLFLDCGVLKVIIYCIMCLVLKNVWEKGVNLYVIYFL